MSCQLGYIPHHLVTGDRAVISTFLAGEVLFYRVEADKLKKPYDNTKLCDISHNRSFFPPASVADDVLYNILAHDDRERYDKDNYFVLELAISNLGNATTYRKEFRTDHNPALVVVMTLKHDPNPCMYPHSVFEVALNDEIVTGANIKQLFKKNRAFDDLKSQIRQELSSMIQNGDVNSTQEVEIIDFD